MLETIIFALRKGGALNKYIKFVPKNPYVKIITRLKRVKGDKI